MAATQPRSRYGRVLLYAVGMLGVFLAVDAALALAFALLTVVLGGGPFNPYMGVVVFLLLPAVFAVGLAIVLWTWDRLSAGEGTGEAAFQGR